MKYLLIKLFLVIQILPSYTLYENDGTKDRDKVVMNAMKYINTSYKTAGNSPKGFDCSGFTQYVYRDAVGVRLQHGSSLQAKEGKKVKLKKAKKGDLIFFKNKGRINHVGIISKVVNNEIWVIHSTSSKGVILEDVNASKYWKARIAFIKSYL